MVYSVLCNCFTKWLPRYDLHIQYNENRFQGLMNFSVENTCYEMIKTDS